MEDPQASIKKLSVLDQGEETSSVVEFGAFRLDLADRLLYREGELVAAPPKVIDTLIALVSRAGQLVSKEQLIEDVWGDTFVEEGNLTQNVFVLRRLLGETQEDRYIETVPRRGYRFVASVTPHAGRGATEDVQARHRQRQASESGASSESPKRAPRWLSRPTLFAIAVALALGVVIGLLAIRSQEPTPASPRAVASEEVTRLVVLPFAPFSGDNADEILGWGLAETVTTLLANLGGLAVRPISSAEQLAPLERDAQSIARELQVDAVLAGRIRSQADQVRVHVELLSGVDGRVLWADHFDSPFGDLFQMEDEIASRVVGALRVELDRENPSSRSIGTRNAEAIRLYFQGRYYAMKLVRFEDSIAAFGRALELDPDFALARAGLAFAHSQSVDLYAPAAAAQERARVEAERALATDPLLTEARLVLAFVRWQYDWDFAAADAEHRRAIELDPNNAIAHSFYSFFLITAGRPEDALREAARGLELDPTSMETQLYQAFALNMAGRADQALTLTGELLNTDESYWLAHLIQGRCYEQLGRLTEAIAEFRRVGELDGPATEALTDLARALAKADRPSEIRPLLDELEALSKQRHVPAFHRAMVREALGERDAAWHELEKAVAERSWYVTWLPNWPEVEWWRGDPRYDELLRVAGLDQVPRVRSAGAP